ncbi:hypothetical protein F5879DRAFT_358755 [Lentinula edodes]|nr:hypothetical protein F5879DRAFT_358755 [Lentinula edodes]
MRFISEILVFVSIASVSLASALIQPRCTGIYQPCNNGSDACCEGLSCAAGVPLGECLPTPGVCGVAGTQCSSVLPTDSCCSGLSCSGYVGTCQ